MDEQVADLERTAELIRGIRVAMLTTLDGDGALQSRPMATQDVDFDGTLWFFTSADSEKADALSQDARVNVAYADPSKGRWVSLSGAGRIVRDAVKIRELWHPDLKAWFPDGLETADLALLEVTVTGGQYWDAPSSKLVRLAGLVKAAVTRNPAAFPGQHGPVDVQH